MTDHVPQSELALRALGVAFSRNENGKITARGPKTVDLRAAVQGHIEPARAWLDGGKNHIEHRLWGECEACKQPMLPYRGGICDVCACAIQKLLDERKANDPPEPPRPAKPIEPAVIEPPVYKDPPWEKAGGLLACRGF